MRFTCMTLTQRLRRSCGRKVILEAEGFVSEIGRLQKVGSRFIKVSGEYFVAQNLNKIIFIKHKKRRRGCQVTVRTTFDKSVHGQLVQVGKDFVELIERGCFRRSAQVLIPLKQVISID